jgi:phosphatidylglycerophosphate synthase
MTVQTELTMRGQSGFVNAPRIHSALTAGMEKRLLVWIARHTPAAITPDHLTVLGFGAQICAGIAYALAARDARALWLVDMFLLLNWLGDSLDGTLARVRNQQRPRYGFYVDHIADTIGAFALMAGLGVSGLLHWPVAAALLVCFYALSIESYLATYTLGRFHLSHGLFGPTELRILLVVGNAAAYFHPYSSLPGGPFLLFDIGGVIGIAGMAAMLFTVAVRHTATLYREETA